MSQIVLAGATFPCSTTDSWGGLYTSSIAPISFVITYTGEEKIGNVVLSVSFLVNGEKKYQTVTVGPEGAEVSPPENATYIEISIQSGTGVPSYLNISVIKTY